VATSDAHRIRTGEDQRSAKRFILDLLQEQSDRSEFERIYNASTTTEAEKSALKEVHSESTKGVNQTIQNFSAKFAIDYVKKLGQQKALTKFIHAYQFAKGFGERIKRWHDKKLSEEIEQIADEKQRGKASSSRPIRLNNEVLSELSQAQCINEFNRWIKASQCFKVGAFQTKDSVEATIEIVVGTDTEGRNKLIEQVRGIIMNLCFSSDTALIYHVIKHSFETPFASKEIGKEVSNIVDEVNLYLQKAKQTVLQARDVKISYCQYDNKKIVFQFICEKLKLQTFISIKNGKAVMNSCFRLPGK